MRVLVTGGAGFIGSHLCRRLLGDGHEVVCVDNFVTGRRENLVDLLAHPRFRLVQHDVQQPLHIDVDQIYHLACPASPARYQANPIRTVKTCFLGTLHMVGLAKRLRIRMLLASTSEVYGDPQVHPQPEDYRGHVNPVGPRSAYDEGKRVAETLVADYRRFHGVDGRIVRIFNTYGPHMDPEDGRVVSNFIVQALSGEPLTIYGDGSQTRSFCYVDDLVEGLVRAMSHPHCHGPINLGNPTEFTVAELADMVRRMTGSEAGVTRRPLPPDDPARRRPDISRARSELSWEPVTPLEEGLKRTIAYFRGELGRTALDRAAHG